MNHFIKILFITIVSFVIIFSACKKDDYKNPFDDINNETSQDSTNLVELDPISIEGLHANIFRPTCANSGCHDGNFDPDFRTIQSSYNTLVNQPIIKNDPQDTYSFRVVPGNAEASQIIARLTFDIDGQSGIMPLTIDPDSNWEAEKEDLIQNIRDWIAAGAKNVGE